MSLVRSLGLLQFASIEPQLQGAVFFEKSEFGDMWFGSDALRICIDV